MFEQICGVWSRYVNIMFGLATDIPGSSFVGRTIDIRTLQRPKVMTQRFDNTGGQPEAVVLVLLGKLRRRIKYKYREQPVSRSQDRRLAARPAISDTLRLAPLRIG
jgi:hypothetical protein